MSSFKKIFLIGFSCCGKTTIGLEISKKLSYNFIDLDIYLHENYQFPIKKNYSKTEFDLKKKLEYDIFKKCLNEDKNIVFSANEGFLINNSPHYINLIFKSLLKEKYVFNLIPTLDVNSSFEILKHRWCLKSNSHLNNLIFEKYYLFLKNMAKFTLITENKSIDEIITQIKSYLD